MLSVIIPTRNRAQLLRRALQSLTQQTLDPDRFEVIVVDNGSVDETRAIVDTFASSLPRCRYLFEPTAGLHAGRHRGCETGVGEVLVYADDDIVATPTWLETIEDCFRDPAVALVGGNNYPDFEAPPPSWLEKLWDRPAHGGRAVPSLSVLDLPQGRRELDPFLVWGCNFSVRKSVLIDAGGFHPDAMPDEQLRFRGDGETHVAAHVRLHRLRCLFDSNASVHHHVSRSRMTLEYFGKRAFSQGISDSYTELRNRSADHAWLRRAKSYARQLRGRMGDIIVADEGLRALRRVMRDGYRRGYEFHQLSYRNDPAVRTWVHKPNYY